LWRCRNLHLSFSFAKARGEPKPLRCTRQPNSRSDSRRRATSDRSSESPVIVCFPPPPLHLRTTLATVRWSDCRARIGLKRARFLTLWSEVLQDLLARPPPLANADRRPAELAPSGRTGLDETLALAGLSPLTGGFGIAAREPGSRLRFAQREMGRGSFCTAMQMWWPEDCEAHTGPQPVQAVPTGTITSTAERRGHARVTSVFNGSSARRTQEERSIARMVRSVLFPVSFTFLLLCSKIARGIWVVCR